MKIAICLTGFVRKAHRCQRWLHERVYPHHDVDLYVATWNVNSHSLRADDVNFAEVDMTYLRNLYGSHLKDAWIGDFEDYKVNRKPFVKRNRPNDVFDVNARAREHFPIWPDRLLDQWFVVKQSWNLIPNPENYDVVMRNRADLVMNFDIPFDCEAEAIHTSCFNYVPNFSMEDKFAWGPPHLMKKYFHLYDHIQAIYDEENFGMDNSEHLVYRYLSWWKEGVPICIHDDIGLGDYWNPGDRNDPVKGMIETYDYEEFKGGWLIGDFEPSLLRTKNFEVCYKYHTKGEPWPAHFHKEGTEYNLLVRGKMKIFGNVIEKGTVFVMRPYEISDAEFLEDCEVLIIKVPSDPTDKYILNVRE